MAKMCSYLGDHCTDRTSALWPEGEGISMFITPCVCTRVSLSTFGSWQQQQKDDKQCNTGIHAEVKVFGIQGKVTLFHAALIFHYCQIGGARSSTAESGVKTHLHRQLYLCTGIWMFKLFHISCKHYIQKSKSGSKTGILMWTYSVSVCL